MNIEHCTFSRIKPNRDTETVKLFIFYTISPVLRKHPPSFTKLCYFRFLIPIRPIAKAFAQWIVLPSHFCSGGFSFFRISPRKVIILIILDNFFFWYYFVFVAVSLNFQLCYVFFLAQQNKKQRIFCTFPIYVST